MKARYRFKRLINKYSHFPVTIVNKLDGYFDLENGNTWVEGKEELIEIQGAVVQLSQDDFQLSEGGPFNLEDRKLYCYEDIKKGTTVRHKGIDYVVANKLDYEDFDISLFLYYIKRSDRVEGY